MIRRCSVLLCVWSALAAGQQPGTLEAIRKYALGYVQNLPDYTCLQVTNRNYTRGRTTHDVVEEELSFVGGKEHYKVTKVNGFAAANPSHEQLGGAVSEGEFGSLLKHIFDPDTGTSFRPAAPEKIQGRAMRVFTFSVPQAKGYSVYDGDQQRELLLAYQGSVWADAETNAVMRLTMKCVDIPSESPLTATELTLEYKQTQLSKQSYILPSHFELVWRRRGQSFSTAPPEEGDNVVDFKLYRRFKADSTISFTD